MHKVNAQGMSFSRAAIGMLVLMHASLLICQSGVDPGTSSPHSLSGTVVDAVTGEPVRRAMVQAAPVNSSQLRSVLTDSEGRFEFSGLPESEISVLAHKPGFFSGADLNPGDFQPEVVHLVNDSSSVMLRLVPEAVVA